ncbi:MAG: radical SAM protein [Chloroflexales bacterium]|nr:radical SAM protein [Chloroflexales bacterium]
MPVPKLRVLLAQLPVPSSPALNTPLAAGYIKAYAEARGLGACAQIEILPRGLADSAGDAALVEAIVARRPGLLGLSLYTWNSERSLAVAHRARARLPGLVVVAGGPEVQPDNPWLLEHPALDVAVIGEGEQTFAALIELLGKEQPSPSNAQWSAISGRLSSIPGVAVRSADGQVIFGPGRTALDDLSGIPSPYLAGHLALPPEGMLMVEVSRWCPYSCGFCLYGRNMGPRLGSRYFGLERVLAEVAWGREHGARRVHFVEANLNLVPIFWPLMRALAELNADRRLTFYAELRGEHLTDEVVAALDTANVRVVEVGLQTSNPAALRAAQRRTDLAKWAAGTRRLYARKITVLLDVILGLPADDADGVAETLRFLEREGLGAYDIFTLQVLPGTAVRREARQHGLIYQDRPPYYVLATDRLGYDDLRRLRYELKLAAGLDPDAVEGLPSPRRDALDNERSPEGLVERVAWPRHEDYAGGEGAPHPDSHALRGKAARLSAHVDVVIPADLLAPFTPLLAGWIEANPTTIFDLYLVAGEAPPGPAALRAWRKGLPFTPGYLDRVAVHSAPSPDPPHGRVSPRLFLVLPWVAQADPEAYAGVAQIIWRYDAPAGEALPLGAWRAAEGGIWLRLDPAAPPAERAALLREARAWSTDSGRPLWCAQH